MSILLLLSIGFYLLKRSTFSLRSWHPPTHGRNYWKSAKYIMVGECWCILHSTKSIVVEECYCQLSWWFCWCLGAYNKEVIIGSCWVEMIVSGSCPTWSSGLHFAQPGWCLAKWQRMYRQAVLQLGLPMPSVSQVGAHCNMRWAWSRKVTGNIELDHGGILKRLSAGSHKITKGLWLGSRRNPEKIIGRITVEFWKIFGRITEDREGFIARITKEFWKDYRQDHGRSWRVYG